MRTIISKIFMKHLVLYVQPIVNPTTKKVFFYEVLSRVLYEDDLHFPNTIRFITKLKRHHRKRLESFYLKGEIVFSVF